MQFTEIVSMILCNDDSSWFYAIVRSSEFDTSHPIFNLKSGLNCGSEQLQQMFSSFLFPLTNLLT